MKKTLAALLIALTIGSMTGCASTPAIAPSTADPASQAAAPKEIPTLTISWGNEMHTGIMNLPFAAPELFKDKSARVNPLSDSHGEIIKDGQVIAIVNRVVTKGGAECATMMGQNHLDVAFTSSTAMLTAYDTGTELNIHAPIQCDGVAIAAVKDAPYSNFEELVAYAKKADMPIKAGYHSAVSSPRIVLESALSEAGLKVTEDPSEFDADVLMIDLKGIQNLIPSLTSKQVDLWAGPAPNPQIAEETGVGKIIATLNDLPGGKWVNFPCCVLAARDEIYTKHPEVIDALASITTDAANFANDHKAEASKLISPIIGVEEDVLMMSNIVYTTKPDERFQNGIGIYFDAMTKMGKFNGRIASKSFDEVKTEVFNFDSVNKLHQN